MTAIGLFILLAGILVLCACETECDQAMRELAQCCSKHPPDAGDCEKLNAQTYIDVGYWPDGGPDAGPDGSYDAGLVMEVPCEGGWLDYARNLANKGLNQKTCTVNP